MIRIHSRQRNTIQCAIAFVAFAVAASAVRAAIIGPYTADSHTRMLYHFDETSGDIVNYGTEGTDFNLSNTGGVNGRDGTVGSNGYGASAYAGFGNAFDVLGSGNGTYHSSTSSTGGGAATSGVSGAHQSLHYEDGTTGAFTYEALVKLSNISNEQQIISRDNSTSTRGFVFYISGGNLILASNDGNSSLSLAIPTTGTDAFGADTWFHVAVSYNGAESTANNVSFYWTRVDPSATEAHLLGTAELLADLPDATGELFIGSTGRSPYRKEIPMIDEVRISDVVRTADQFIFTTATVPTPATLPGGLALLACAAMKRRRR